MLLHPLGADRRVWDPLVGSLREQREVVAVDLPGFGESPPLRGQTPTPRALAGAVASLLASVGLERAHLAGNSLGAWVALELALRGTAPAPEPEPEPGQEPESESEPTPTPTPTAMSVCAIAPAGLWPEPLVPKASIGHRLARATLPLARRLVRTRSGRSLLLTGSVAHPDRVPPADAAALVRAYALAPDFIAVNNAMRAGRFEGLERIRCPVTLVWPTHDRLIRRPISVPDGVRELVLDDTGHIPIWDAPQELTRILLDVSGDAEPAVRKASAAAPSRRPR